MEKIRWVACRQGSGAGAPCVAAVLLVLLMSWGCAAHYPINPGEGSVERQLQYQMNKMEQAQSDEIFMVLCFSGGGTRAASMSYGVLEALNAVYMPVRPTGLPEGQTASTKTLLDEVNVIMSVSGGSFTAAYYGLHGKDIFKNFREDFLLRDVQGALFWSVMNPLNWPRLFSAQFDRSDLAQEYYDEILFKGATLGDMIRKKGPLVNILATDAIEGISFSFVPQHFNMICSDYDRFPVSRAVTASSAFPGPFSPIVLKNYAGHCDYKVPEWVTKAIEKPDLANRVFWMASSLYLYTDATAKPYIYLIDGGVSDNLGVRAIFESVAGQGGMRKSLAKSGLPNLGKVAFVVVDAQTRVQRGTLLGEIPGLGFVLDSSSSIMINRNNFDTMDLLRRYVLDWNAEDVKAGRKPLDIYIVHLNFDSLPDMKEREFFNHIPTALSLPAEQVDKLRDVAKRLLYSNPDFRKLVTDIGASIPAKTDPSFRQPTVIVPGNKVLK